MELIVFILIATALGALAVLKGTDSTNEVRDTYHGRYS